MRSGTGAILLGIPLLLAACAEEPSERTLGTLVRPLGVAAAWLEDGASGHYVLVANSGDDSLAVVDVQSEQFLDFVPGNTLRRNALPVGRMPVAVEVAPDQGRAFVLNALEPELAVIDLPGFEPVARFPVGEEIDDFLVADLGGRTVGFASRPVAGLIEVYDLDAYRLLASWAVSGVSPRGLALGSGGQRLFAANAEADDVVELALDPDTLGSPEVLARHDVGGITRRVAVDPDGAFLYALKQVENSIAVIDLAQGVRIDANPETVELDAAEGRDHELDVLTGGVPMDLEVVRYDYIDQGADGGIETVTIVFVTDYDGLLRGFDMDRDQHKIFDLGRGSMASAAEPSYRLADGTSVTLPNPDHPSLQPIDPEDEADVGIEVFYRVTRSEAWAVIYNGQISGAYQLTRGSLDLTGRRFVDTSADFIEDGVEVGDVLTIDSAPVGEECPLLDAEEIEDVELAIVQVEATALHFAESEAPLAECYAERELSFTIRTDGSYAVNGSESGFKGRAVFGETYENLLVRFTLVPPENASATLEPGSGWLFSTSSGVEALVLDAGSLPGGFTFTQGDPAINGDEYLFVSNSNYGGIYGSRGGLVQVDAQTFEALVQYY